ncbi:MAG: PKD-like domain-containing protein, partial [Bacteroidota bacterium]|nr:PKD-like domain-containing protein [Bacteroidota bacterium]
NPVPFATASPASQAICSGNTTSIALSSFTPGTTFSWTVVQSAGVSGGSLGSGTTIAQTLSTTGTSPGTATYTVTPVATGCVGNPLTVVVTVNPIPVATATPATQTICSGGTSSIALTSTVSGTLFNWTVVQTGVTGASNSSSSTTIAETLTTTGVVAGTAVYTITPTANGCAGAPIAISITVNPTPVVTATPSSQTICSGSTTSITLTSNVSGTTFAWTVVQAGGVSGGANGTGTLIADVLTSATAGTAVYTITPTAASCPGTPVQVTVNVNPMDDASFSYSAATYCQTGVDPSATVTGLPGGLFSSTAGLVFLNTSTGLVDLSASTLGTYTVTYTTNGIC